MKNIENKNITPESEENSLEGLSHEEIAKKFEQNMDKLKDIAKKEAKENNEDPEKILDKIDDFFAITDNKEKEELENIDTKSERKVLKKYKKILNRKIDVQKEIINSGEFVLEEIRDWKKEKNPVAKSLLRITKWILKTEK
ncbi:MAG TPA: hypothetical protein VJ892_01680 [Candidatus Absconditabacterales bacterium]|nr:hypothetical protein [Candidatus Absconditabacterales bacterium]